MKLLESVAQRATGKSAQELRDQPISELRREVETKSRRRMRFLSNFLFVGRGNVIRDKILSHGQVETLLDEALKE